MWSRGLMEYLGIWSTARTSVSRVGRFLAHDMSYRTWKITLRTSQDSGTEIIGALLVSVTGDWKSPWNTSTEMARRVVERTKKYTESLERKTVSYPCGFEPG